MSYCRNCGNKLNPTSKFCSKCGEQVISDDVVKSMKGSNKKRKVAKILVWTIIPVIILVLVVSLIPNSNPSETDFTNSIKSSEINTNLIDELIQHFKKDGIIGIKTQDFDEVPGAIFGCGYETAVGSMDDIDNQTFVIQLYLFEDKTTLEKNLNQIRSFYRGSFNRDLGDMYTNGSILMFIYDLKDFGANNESIKKKIVSSFNSFRN